MKFKLISDFKPTGDQLKQKEQQLKRAEQNKERRTKQLAAELERENKVLNSRVVDAKKRLEQVFEQASKQYIENKLNTVHLSQNDYNNY